MKKWFLLCSALLSFPLFADSVNFISKPMSAGKASLAENAYSVSRLLDTANFSPELKLPVQLVYNSSVEKSGLFGFAWRSPQLESTAYYDKDGVLWVTPWGERIKFFPKKEKGKKNKDAVKIELYEQAKKGRGFYAPYSEWEADTSRKRFEKYGDWEFRGKRDKSGWCFIYRQFKLKKIIAPTGRSIDFKYVNDKLVSVSQDGKRFIELVLHSNIPVCIKINGVRHDLRYRSVALAIMPNTGVGGIINANRLCLKSIKQGDLSPVCFDYDDYGFLNSITQGDYTDKLVIQHQTLDERRRELNDKAKYSGPVNGRILSDNQYKYSYNSAKPGNVTLANKLNRKAVYNFNQQTGIFKISEFSGKSYTIYYFMRHDVAYLGKVRKIVDSRGRDLINYRYDKLTGNVIRVRDMAGNDINFRYGNNGKIILISRRGADQDAPEPVRGFWYDQNKNLIATASLNKQAKPVVVMRLEYNQFRQPVEIRGNQFKNRIGYNSFGYPVTFSNVFGQFTQRELDDYNRMISSTDFYGVKTYYTYTPAGLIAKIERKDGEKRLTSLAIAYNANGQPIRYTDQSGKVKKFERDAFGRVVKELFPDDTEVAYTYNKLGQLHTVLDQNKHKITFDWNKFGLDAKTTPAGQLTDYVHDKYGLLTRLDSKQGRENARSIKYTYDQYDRLIKLDYGNGDIETRTYDSWGKLRSTERGDVKENYRYDYFGRMTAKTGTKEKLFITYNPYGQRTRRQIERNGIKMDEIRSYDKYGRLQKIVAGGKTLEYVYNPKNQIQQQIINGKVVEFSYNKYGQLKSKRMLEK